MSSRLMPPKVGSSPWLVIFVLILLGSTTSYIVEPGTRGIKVTLGKTANEFLPEGFGLKTPYGIPVPTWSALKGRKKRPRKPVSGPDDQLGLRAEVLRAKFLRVAKGRIRLLRGAGIYVNCTAADAAQEDVAEWLEHRRDSRINRLIHRDDVALLHGP